MSLARYIFAEPEDLQDFEWWTVPGRDFSSPRRFRSLLSAVPTPMVPLRPFRERERALLGVGGGVCEDENKFRVKLDVKQFKPAELSVRTQDNTVTVEGRHEEKPDEHGYISRHFVRRYVLPEDVDVQHVQSQLSSDGILCICVPKKVEPAVEGSERAIPIVHTHLPAALPAAPPAVPHPAI